MYVLVGVFVYVCMHAARPVAHHPHIGSTLRQAVISHNAQPVLQPPSLSVPPSMTLSTSCPQQLDARFLESSLDSLQLTQMEIDAIRSLGRPGRGSGTSSPSTPTSQLSQPDFVDPRPDIYRFVYDISPGSRSRASDSLSVGAEGGDARLSEFQQGSKFDDVIIAAMDHPAGHHGTHWHKTKMDSCCVNTVSSRESEVIDEALQQHTAKHADPRPVPACAASATCVYAASEPEMHVSVMSTSAPVQSSEAVISVGDALVAVQQGSELVTSDDEMQQTPAALPTDMPCPGPCRLHDAVSARIHKGSGISVPAYLTHCVIIMTELMDVMGALWRLLYHCL